jgi:thiamine-phosphate pyrophosphorylase
LDAGENGLEILGRIRGYGLKGGGQFMASALARAKLARTARTLNAPFHRSLPALILMTDEMRLPAPAAVASVLPKASAIILRHTDENERRLLAKALRPIARERRLMLIIAGDAPLADDIAADGLHLPEARAREAAHWKALRPTWLVTAAAHSARGLVVAQRSGADAVLLAPAFPTLSHTERAPLGVARFRLIAQHAPLPVYALGGVNAQTVQRLLGAVLAGVAAIEGLIPS